MTHTTWIQKIKQFTIEAVAVGSAGGLMVAVSPKEIRPQVAYGAIAAVAPIMVVASGWRYNARMTDELREQAKVHSRRQAELAQLQVSLSKTRESLDKRAAECELAEASIRNQLENLQKARIDGEYDFREQAAKAEAELQQAAIKLERMRADIDNQRTDLQMSVRRWEEIEKEQLKLELKREIEAERQNLLAEWEKTKSDLREAELTRIRQLEQEYLEKAVELERSRADWEIERARASESHTITLEREKSDWEAERARSREEGEKQLFEQYTALQQQILNEQAEAKEQLYKQASTEFGKQRDAYLQEIDRLNQVITQMRSQVIALNEQIAKQRKPVTPQGVSVPHSIATVVHGWILSHGVMCDFVSIQYVDAEECWQMVVSAWWEQGVQLKDFKKLEGISRSSLKLVEQVKFEDALEGVKCHFKLSPSAELNYASPREKLMKRARSLERGLTSPDTLPDLDAVETLLALPSDPNTKPSSLESEDVKHHVTRLERKHEFMVFTSTALTQGYFPVYGEITDTEEKTIQFWCQYQDVCFGRENLDDERAVLKVYGASRVGVRSSKSDYEAAIQRLASIKKKLHIGSSSVRV